MSSWHVRTAEPRDLPDLVRIYNHYVLTTAITFDIEPYTVETRRPWFDGFSGEGPHRLLVAEVAERPVGYASSGVFRAKAAYARSVESTIYLDPACTGRGIGSALYAALLDALCAEKSVHRAYAGIALPNPGSIALHERAGFRRVGTLREVGFKFDRYWDVSWFEKNVARPPR